MRDNLVAETTPRRLGPKVAGPAIAAGAISLGLVVIGACGLRPHDTYVAPPPLSANLPSAAGTRAPTSTTYEVYIPPSPSWRVAVNTPPRRTPTTVPLAPTTPGYAQSPGDGPGYAAPAYIPPPSITTDDPFDSTTTPSGPP
ncbi:hypothetical protein ABIA39_004959 [Nocardia sp. GAS34]|jgi:hypothetical protein|uniref:hypothetical protein n=1 Tax=unclassified Nocardia TaxID=2637762 RepID=UPI003D1EE51F